jgi:hypothetical protein
LGKKNLDENLVIFFSSLFFKGVGYEHSKVDLNFPSSFLQKIAKWQQTLGAIKNKISNISSKT